MTKMFRPTWMVKTIYHVTPQQLKARGIKAVFTDLDNTLIAWNNPNGTQELHDWMDQLAVAGIPLIVVSNNNRHRISRAVAPLGLPFVSRALKPLPVGIKRALRERNLAVNEVVMVGDQLLTDIVASNLAGVRSILVRPLVNSDQWNTKINRFFEKFIMHGMLKNNPTLTWQEELDD